MGKKIVVALGGNAILTDDPTAAAQQAAVRKTAEYLVNFVENGDQLVIAHGNGPQVGNILLQQAAGATKDNPAMPMDTVGAMTQGSIGYWIETAMTEALEEHGIDKEIACIITQCEVSADDPALSNPSKPVGPFYTKEEMLEKSKEHPDFKYVEDAGRGYRRVVPSPKPTFIRQYKAVNDLLNAGIVPIACGGGGIPVINKDDKLTGVEGVIDKDFASSKLAELIDADMLVILTAVDNVYVHYNKPDQKKLEHVTVADLKPYIEADEFAKGSMLPKVQAAIDFVENNPEGKAVITSLENVDKFLKEGKGTIITKD